MLLTQLRFGIEASELPSEIGIALLEYYLPEEYLAGEGREESQVDLELLDADFFDDECVVIIYRLRKRESQCANIAILHTMGLIDGMQNNAL